MVTHSNPKPESEVPLERALPDTDLGNTIREAVREYLHISREQTARKSHILKLAKELVHAHYQENPNEPVWWCKPDIYYIGPDVDNKELIFFAGRNVNGPVLQMQTLGMRARLRTRVNPKQAEKAALAAAKEARLKRDMKKHGGTWDNPFNI